MNVISIFINSGLASLFGWIGTFSYLLSYLLLTINKLKANQKIYHVLNIIGAAGLACNAVFFGDYPNVVVNVLWAAIALTAIFFIWRKKLN